MNDSRKTKKELLEEIKHLRKLNKKLEVAASKCEEDIRDIFQNPHTQSFLKQRLSVISYREIFNAINDAIWVHELSDGKIVDVNTQVTTMFGYSYEEALQLDIEEISSGIPPYTKKSAMEFFHRAAKGKPQVFEWHSKHKEGWFFWTEVTLQRAVIEGKECVIAIERDITHRLKTEKLLKEKEEKFSNLFNAMPNGFYRSSPEGYFIEANPAFVKMLGYESFEELKYVHIPSTLYVNEQERNEVLFYNPDFNNTHEVYRLKKKNGEVVWIEDNARYIKDSQGKVLYHEGICQDITRRKLAEEELARSKQMLELVMDTIPQSVFWKDHNGVYLGCNTRGAHLLELNHPADIIGKTDSELGWSHSEATLLKRLHQQVMDKGEMVCQIIESQQKTGHHQVWYETTMIPMQSPVDKRNDVLVMMDDISERKQTEIELVYQSQMQEILTNIATKYINLPLENLNKTIHESLEEIGRFVKIDRVYVFDYYWEKGYCSNTYEWCDEGVTSQKDQLRAVPLEMVPWWVEKHKKGETLYIVDVLALPKQDGVRQILEPQGVKSLMAIPMMQENHCIGFIGFDAVKNHHYFSSRETILLSVFAQMLVNIYTRKQLEQDLIAAKEEALQKEKLKKKVEVAEESLRFKQNFLANMSHEIRTPLTGILGMAEILDKTPLNEDQADYVQTIQQAGENLQEIIDNVLDFSKIEAGKVTLKEKVFAWQQIQKKTEGLFKSICKKPISFSFLSGSDIPNFLLADENRIMQIMTNLVSNAVKFTDKGDIRVYASLRNEFRHEETVEIEIMVKDTGIGIQTEKIKQLFTPFTQVDDSDTRQFEGTGLGLSISKELVHLLGGEISVDSVPGEGSTFGFSFKARKATQMQLKNEDREQTGEVGPNLKILLVEDTRVNQKVITLLLASMGHVVTLAGNGVRALELFEPLAYDLILMDIQMPVMDGITATQKLREKYVELPPIVGLSANAFEGDREKYMAKGLDEYITKPFKAEDFKEVLARVF